MKFLQKCLPNVPRFLFNNSILLYFSIFLSDVYHIRIYHILLTGYTCIFDIRIRVCIAKQYMLCVTYTYISLNLMENRWHRLGSSATTSQLHKLHVSLVLTREISYLKYPHKSNNYMWI